MIVLSLLLLLEYVSAVSLDYYASPKDCARYLESTIFKPESCAYKYMERLAIDFRIKAQPVLFTPQVDQFIYSFETSNQIKVALIDAFGLQTSYHPNGTKTTGSYALYSDTAQAYTNFPGFVRQINADNFYYTFEMFSTEGQYYGVTLSMPLSDDPLVC